MNFFYRENIFTFFWPIFLKWNIQLFFFNRFRSTRQKKIAKKMMQRRERAKSQMDGKLLYYKILWHDNFVALQSGLENAKIKILQKMDLELNCKIYMVLKINLPWVHPSNSTIFLSTRTGMPCYVKYSYNWKKWKW